MRENNNEQDGIYYGITNCTKRDMVVCKSRPLLNLTKSDLSLLELKLLDLYLARINPKNDERDIVVFEKSELEKMLHVKRIESRRLEAALEHLTGYVITLYLEPKRKRHLTLFAQAELEYEDEARNTTPTIRLQCNPLIKQYIFHPDTIGYLRSNIYRVTSFKTRHAYSLYQYIGQNKFRGEWKVSISTLKAYMGLAGHYDDFKDFKRDVLKPAIREIKKMTGMDIGFNLVRKNRKAQSLQFYLWHDDESTKYAEPTETPDEELPFLWDEEPDSAGFPENPTEDENNVFGDIDNIIF